MAKLWNSLTLFASKLLDGRYFGYDSSEEWWEAETSKMEADAARFDSLIWIPIVIFSVIFVVINVIIVVSVIKAKKKTGELAIKVKDKIKENIEHEKTKDICPYCGTRLQQNENRCPSCGAQRK